MAMIDYGCVVIKNGIVQNTNEFFMNMKRSVGWIDKEITGNETRDDLVGIMNDNYMGYIGDEDLTIAFYKLCERVHIGHVNIDSESIKNIPEEDLMLYMSDNMINDFNLSRKWYKSEYFLLVEKWISKTFKIDVPNYGIVEVHVKYISNPIKTLLMRYKVKMLWMTYKGDHYRVIYGYGIDSNWNVWNKIKVKYLGKKLSKKIDSIYRTYIKDYGYKALIDQKFKYIIGYNGPDSWDYDNMIQTLRDQYNINIDDLGEYDKSNQIKLTPNTLDDIADCLNKEFKYEDRFKAVYLFELSKIVSPDNPYKFVLYPEKEERIMTAYNY